jgi:hypothetical protein
VRYDPENFIPQPEEDGLHRQPRPTSWIIETDQLFFQAVVAALVLSQLLSLFAVYQYLQRFSG